MDPALRQTLEATAAFLKPARDPWWIIGGAAMALLGHAEAAQDVDVILSRADASALAATAGLRNLADGGTPRFRSDWLLRPDLGPIMVEAMGGFRIRSHEGWIEARPASRRPVALGSAMLFVPEAQDLARLFRLCGRERDIRRARQLTG